MDIYIKPVKKATIAEKEIITIGDIAEVSAEPDISARILKLKLLKTGNTKKAYLVSVLDIINAIDKSLPGNSIVNVGEMDSVVEFSPKAPKKNAAIKWLKVAFVSVLLTAGSSTAIMSFHSDAEIPEVFKNYYKIFYGVEVENPWIIEIPYSLGLAVGIVVFFNHLMGRKLTNDPTPIEVEMAVYENSVTTTMIDVLNVEKQKKSGGGS